MSFVPLYCRLQRGIQIPSGFPPQLQLRFGTVEAQILGLVRMGTVIEMPGQTWAPQLSETFKQCGNGQIFRFVGTKIPAFRKPFRVLPEFLSESQVSRQGFEYMLPGADGLRMPDQ